MQIPCSDNTCLFQEYGECTLNHVIAGQPLSEKCSYYRSKKNQLL